MEKTEILSPLIDIIFKAIFGNPKNIDILTAFIKSVLNIDDEDFDTLEITDTNLKVDAIDDKVGILDVKAYAKSGKVIDVEVQIMFVPELRERIIFYTSKMITEQINKGQSYNQIQKVISIIILNFILIKENSEYHNTFQLYDKDTNTTFSDVLEIHTLELPKLPSTDDDSDLFDWLTFFKSSKKEEFVMLASRSSALQRAYEELENLSQDKMTRERYESVLKAKRDEVSRLRDAEERGENKGKIEGKIEIAKKMLSKGMSIAEIADLTGLTEDEIKVI